MTRRFNIVLVSGLVVENVPVPAPAGSDWTPSVEELTMRWAIQGLTSVADDGTRWAFLPKQIIGVREIHPR